VFPGPGRLQEWPKPRIGGGGALLYQNFRKRYGQPAFKRLKLPYVTPHSARHSFISTLQAEGIEVGLVAQIAGHSATTPRRLEMAASQSLHSRRAYAAQP
jgi:integrase